MGWLALGPDGGLTAYLLVSDEERHSEAEDEEAYPDAGHGGSGDSGEGSSHRRSQPARHQQQLAGRRRSGGGSARRRERSSVGGRRAAVAVAAATASMPLSSSQPMARTPMRAEALTPWQQQSPAPVSVSCYACFYSGQVGHWVAHCPQKEQERQERDRCYSCDQIGRWSIDCPQRRAW